jgi:hypothetical protein
MKAKMSERNQESTGLADVALRIQQERWSNKVRATTDLVSLKMEGRQTNT